MKFIKKLFKDRTVGFCIGLAAAGVALIADILYLILAQFANILFTNTHPLEQTFLICAIILFFLGSISQALIVWKDLKFAPLIPVVFFSVAFALHFYLACFPLADLLTGIAFFGGSAPLAIIFIVIFGLCTIASAVSCFMSQKKTQTQLTETV